MSIIAIEVLCQKNVNSTNCLTCAAHNVVVQFLYREPTKEVLSVPPAEVCRTVPRAQDRVRPTVHKCAGWSCIYRRNCTWCPGWFSLSFLIFNISCANIANNRLLNACYIWLITSLTMIPLVIDYISIVYKLY